MYLNSKITVISIGYQKRRIGMSAQGFHGDTFSDGFGGFQTMKKRQQDPVEVFDYPQQFLQGMQIDEVTTFLKTPKSLFLQCLHHIFLHFKQNRENLYSIFLVQGDHKPN